AECRPHAPRRLQRVRCLRTHVAPRLPALRADPAGLHALHASDGRRRVGRLPRDGAELVPGGPARRRPDRLRALRPTPPRHRQGDGLGAAALRSRLVPVELPRQRRRRGGCAGVVAARGRVGGPDPPPRRFPPHAAPRRPLAALTGAPTGRSRLSRPARPDAAARRHPLASERASAAGRGVPPIFSGGGGGRLRHWITRSARSTSDCGTRRPGGVAVLTLMTRSILVGCSTGRSAGLTPFRMRSTYLAAR